MKPPTTIKIGPYLFRVCYGGERFRAIADANDTLTLSGGTQRRNQSIVLADDLPMEMERETLLHEIMHACFVLGEGLDHVKRADLEERAVGTLSPVLFMVLRDNPGLVRYLMERADG